MKQLFFITSMCILALSLNAQFRNQEADAAFAVSTTWQTEGGKPGTLVNPEGATTFEINGTATCFCVVSYNDLTGQTGRSGVCMDLTATVNKTYNGLLPMKDENRKDCQKRCSDAAYNLTPAQKQAIADCACAAGVASGTAIRAYGAVGTKEYQSDQALGILVNTPAVSQTTCKCPAGWMSNTTNIDGGVTGDGHCKKIVCQPISITPFPANGTQLGNWGFAWGNALYAWGTAANGGAATCTTVITQPKQCRLQ